MLTLALQLACREALRASTAASAPSNAPLTQAADLHLDLQRDGASLAAADQQLRAAVQRTDELLRHPASPPAEPAPAPAPSRRPKELDKGKLLMAALTGKGRQRHKPPPADEHQHTAVLSPVAAPVAQPWSMVGSAFGEVGGYGRGLAELQRLATAASTAIPGSNTAVEALLRHVGSWNAFGPLLNAASSAEKTQDEIQRETAGAKRFDYVIAIMASHRPVYLSLLLAALEEAIPDPERVLVVVSHDGAYPATIDAVVSTCTSNVSRLHRRQPPRCQV